MRWRMADFCALFSVMMFSSRRVGPRLPAMVKEHDEKRPRVVDPCPRRHAGAGRSLARKRAGGALPLAGRVPSLRGGNKEGNTAIHPGENLTFERHPSGGSPAADPVLVMDPELGRVEADGQRQRDLDAGQQG